MPARPSPLITKGHGIMGGASKSPFSPFSPLPSELPRTPVDGRFDAIKNHDEAMKTPITPPTAYTEFLKATINSPAVSSAPPTSLPYSPVSASTSSFRHSGYFTPVTPYPPPMSAQLAGGGMRRSRRGVPPSPSSANSSPSTESPRSARSTRSCPVDDEEEEDDDDDDVEDAAQLSDGRVTVKQTITTTVTYTPRMALLPAPKGKRRRVA